MTVILRRKRGDSFRLRFLREGGLEGVTVTASLKFSALELPLQAAILDPAAGIFELSFEGDTSQWPTGRAACDIRYARAGQIARTDTFFVQIMEAITP